MAYEVGKKYSIRPLKVLLEWTCEELLVSFGVLMNEMAHIEYERYKHLDPKVKREIKDVPSEYVFKFITFDQLAESHQTQQEVEEDEEELMDAQIQAFMKGGGFIG